MKRAPWLSVQICAQDYSKIEYIFVSKYLELLDKSVEKSKENIALRLEKAYVG